MIIIKTIKNSEKNKRLWYFEYQNQKFQLAFDTKKGYLVNRKSDNGKNSMYLVKHSHADLIDDDIV